MSGCLTQSIDVASRLPSEMSRLDGDAAKTGFLEGRKMIHTSQTERTAGTCSNCNRHSPASDNFCRWCGFNHSQDADVPGPEWQIGNTTVLGRDEEKPRSFSRLPLYTLSLSVATKTGTLRLNRYGALAMAVLIAFPMWLLIVLLSPFDAYLSAKAAWSQMNIR